MTEDSPQHDYYAQHLANVNQTRGVVASTDITNSQGALLVACGQHLDARTVDRVVQHKLSKPIENSVELLDAVDGEGLYELLQNLWVRIPELAIRQKDAQEALQNLCQNYGRIPILVQKFTVLHMEFAVASERSLFSALLSFQILFQDELTDEIEDGFLAALCQDFGYLHIDPDVGLEKGDRTPTMEKSYLAHPVLSHFCLKNVEGISSAMKKAVLHHEERMDGSGFPRQIHGSHLDRLEQLLWLANRAHHIYFHRLKPIGFSLADYTAILTFQHGMIRSDIWRLALNYFDRLPHRQRPVVTPRDMKQHVERMLVNLPKLLQTFTSLYGLVMSLPLQEKMPLNTVAKHKAMRLRVAMASAGLIMEAHEQFLREQQKAFEPEFHLELEQGELVQAECQDELSELTRTLRLVVTQYDQLSPDLVQLISSELQFYERVEMLQPDVAVG